MLSDAVQAKMTDELYKQTVDDGEVWIGLVCNGTASPERYRATATINAGEIVATIGTDAPIQWTAATQGTHQIAVFSEKSSATPVITGPGRYLFEGDMLTLPDPVLTWGIFGH